MFKSHEILNNHYTNYGDKIKKALRKNSYSLTEYLDDANYIISNETYANELNGYIKFMSNKNYGFVGLDRVTGNITTFHIKNVDDLIKKFPSLGFGKW